MIGWLSMAWAGTVRVHAPTPVTVKVDDQVVGRVTTEVVVDLEPGGHSIEVLDPFGAVLASTEVVIREGADPVWLDYYAHRLLPVERSLVPDGVEPISDVGLQWIEVKLAKKRNDKKRVKLLAPMIPKYWFEMRHVDRLLVAFDSLDVRVEIAQLLAARTIDPEKTGAIESHFPPGEFRERALRAFAAYQRPALEDEE
ncbi:MAG: DUF4476 domain-containing protein [Myxococcota bacterium]